MIDLTNETFDDVIGNASVPVLVDYWATWCQPCKMVAPILEQLDVELAGRLLIAKVDVDANEGLASGLSSVPTFRIYKDGVVVKEWTGAKPKPFFDKELAEVL